MENKIMQLFAELVVDSRQSGIRIYLNYWKNGNRPKDPGEDQKALISLIETLSEDQKAKLTTAIKFCIDRSFFKLLSDLEQGTKELEFTLTAFHKEQRLSLINPEEDLEIRSNYFGWVEGYDKQHIE